MTKVSEYDNERTNEETGENLRSQSVEYAKLHKSRRRRTGKSGACGQTNQFIMKMMSLFYEF